MIGDFFRKLFGLCDHLWKRMPSPPEEHTLVRFDPNHQYDGSYDYDVVHMRSFTQAYCRRCGRMMIQCVSERSVPLSAYTGDRSKLIHHN